MPAIFFGGIAVSFFSVLLFASRRPFRLSDGIASLLLFMLAVPVIVKMVLIGIVPPGARRWLLFLLTVPFVYGPLLYLYAAAEITEKPAFQRSWLLHFIPCAVFAALSFIFVFSELDMKKDARPDAPAGRIEEELPTPGPAGDFRLGPDGRGEAPPPPAPGMAPPAALGRPGPPPHHIMPLDRVPFMGLSMLISFISYTAATAVMLLRHKKRMPDYFSTTSMSTTLKWIQWIMVAFFMSYSFVYLSLQIAPSLLRHPLLDPRMTPDIAICFFIVVFAFFSLRQPAIFREPDPRHGGDGNERGRGDQGEKKYEKSGLKDDDAARYLLALEDYMEKDKPYLDPDLTIADLSGRLGIPRHYLTQVINERLNKNFYLFVNEYRVREAMEIIADPAFSGHTILRIAYDVGFNSKSAFNAIFKRLTSRTPTEYRLAYGPK